MANSKRILAKIYSSQFVQNPLNYLEESLNSNQENLKMNFSELKQQDLVEIHDDRPRLTPLGRSNIVVVMTGGAFDLIHPGHVETLEQAKALGDALFVSVARDSTFERNKKRKPLHNEMLRQRLVGSLRVVDLAVLGSETDIFETVILLKPDIIALGYDQAHNDQDLLKQIRRHNLDVRVVRLTSSVPDIKTSSILNDKLGSTSNGTVRSKL